MPRIPIVQRVVVKRIIHKVGANRPRVKKVLHALGLNPGVGGLGGVGRGARLQGVRQRSAVTYPATPTRVWWPAGAYTPRTLSGVGGAPILIRPGRRADIQQIIV